MVHISTLTLLQQMELHLNTLFCMDEGGRLRCVNEMGEPPAPIFVMGRTLQGNLWRFRYDLPPALIDELERLCLLEPVATHLAEMPHQAEAIRSAIREHLGLSRLQEYSGPAYWIPEGRAQATDKDRDKKVVLITPSTANAADLLAEDFAWMIPQLSDPQNGLVAAAVEKGRVVSLCFCSRRPGVATEAGLETVEGFRGKGYATAVVRAWAAAVEQTGCIPLYSTSWDNLASQAVARKLGMMLYGEDWSIR